MANCSNQLPERLAAEYMLLPEALYQTGMSESTFRRRRAEGIFRCKQWMSRIIVKRADVDRWLKHLESV